MLAPPIDFARWIAEHVGASVGYLGEAANSVGAQLVNALPGDGGLDAGAMLAVFARHRAKLAERLLEQVRFNELAALHVVNEFGYTIDGHALRRSLSAGRAAKRGR